MRKKDNGLARSEGKFITATREKKESFGKEARTPESRKKKNQNTT